jgi:hypothetical protein
MPLSSKMILRDALVDALKRRPRFASGSAYSAERNFKT